jgi:hypothetical protein
MVEGSDHCLRQLEYIITNKCARFPSYVDHGLDPSYIIEKYAFDERLDSRFREKTLATSLARVRKLLERKKAEATGT